MNAMPLGAETQSRLLPVVINLWVIGAGIKQAWAELQLCQVLIKKQSGNLVYFFMSVQISAVNDWHNPDCNWRAPNRSVQSYQRNKIQWRASTGNSKKWSSPEDWWGKKRIGDYNWQGRRGKHKWYQWSELWSWRKTSSDRTLGRWTDILISSLRLHPSWFFQLSNPTRSQGVMETKESSPERSEPQGVDWVRKMYRADLENRDVPSSSISLSVNWGL